LKFRFFFKKFRFRNWSFSARLIFIVLVFTIIPLVGFATFSLQLFKQYILKNAETELNYIAKSIIMLCEAQEALDRLKRGEAGAQVGVDGVTGASPNWQDGNEYKSLRSIVKDIRVGETGYCYVFNSSGSIIIHPYLEKQNFFQLQDERIAEHFIEVRNKAVKLPVGAVETMRYPWLDENSGKIKPKIAKFGYFKPYDWIIGVACFESELMRPYNRAKLAFYALLALITVSVPILVFFPAKGMMRPVVQLADAAARIAKGEYPSIKRLGSKDEIGKLVRSFDTMVEKLQEERIHQLEEWNRQLEAKVQERTKELEQAYTQLLTMEKHASLGKISSMVAHELNNPMSGILSYARYCEMMLSRKEPDSATCGELKESLSFIVSEAERCGDIVKNLLMFAKRSWGDFKKIRCREVIERGLRVLEHSFKVNEISLKQELEGKNDEIWCDPSAMEQVIIGLVINAIEAIKRTGTVTIREDYSSAESVTIEIEDNGPGISPDILPHIFEPFVTTKENKVSTGLGLSVVYAIIQAHNGSIEVASELGGGTKFTVTLPRTPPEHPRIKEGFIRAVRSSASTKGDSDEA